MNRLFYLPLIFKVTLVVGLLLVASSFTWQGEKTAEEYFNDGLNNMKKKDYLKAIGDFTHAISLNPQYAEAYYQRAIAKDLFGQQIGFFNPELCSDLIEAAKLNYKDAIPLINKLASKECHSLNTAFLDPEMTYCADFNSKVLAKIPELTRTLRNLTHLNLWNNRLTTLDFDFEFTPYLVNLNVSANHLQTIHPRIGKARFLYEIDFSKNQLAQLPEEIKHLQSLHTLILRNNAFKTLPSSLKELKNLQLLDLSLNQFEKIPEVLAEMKTLKTLILSGNMLSEKEVEQLRQKLPTTQVIF